MRKELFRLAFAIACATAAVTACKSNKVSQTANTSNNFVTVTPEAGGTIEGPDGTKVFIPPGAVSAPITVGIVEAEPSEHPEVPESFKPTSKVYEFQPIGHEFLVDVSITLPALTDDINVYRAEPGASWQEHAEPKTVNGFVTFKTTSFSYFLGATGGYSDGPDKGDGGTNEAGGTCGRVPAEVPDRATLTSTLTGMPTTDGVASTETTALTRIIRIRQMDYDNACGHALQRLEKPNSQQLTVSLRRTSSTGLPPPDFVVGTEYPLGYTNMDGVEQNIMLTRGMLDAECTPVGATTSTGKVTLTSITATRIAGTYEVTGGVAYTGTFDVPICNSMRPDECCLR